MANPADKYAQKTFSQLESQMSRMYREAYKDVSGKLTDFTRRHKAKDKQMQRDLKKGKITQDQYSSWLRGQVFIGQRWQDTKDSLNLSIKNVMTEASQLIHDRSVSVFVDNANYTAFQIEKDHGFTGGVNFTMYDRKTVSRLMLEDPELLPRRRDVDGRKLEAWNTKVIANCVTQSILQGESIDELSKRIARDTCMDAGKSSLLYARTAMTGAQNAGRVERMKEADEMGIKVQKQWMSTLDSHTRDSHRDMDGEIADVDEEFTNGLEYPGDFGGDPREVYNCRCTLIYHYPEYSDYSNMERTAYYEEGDPEYDPEHRNYETVKGMNYEQWTEYKQDQIRQRYGGLTTTSASKQEPPVVDKRNERISNIMHSHTVDQMTAEQKQEFSEILAGMADEHLELYEHMVEFHKDNNYIDGPGWYDPKVKKVEMTLNANKWEKRIGRKDSTGAWKTKFHEELHQLDHILNITRGNGPYGSATACTPGFWETPTDMGRRMKEAIHKDVISFFNKAIDKYVEDAHRTNPKFNLKHIEDLSKPIQRDVRYAVMNMLADVTHGTGNPERARALLSPFTDAIGLTTGDRISPYSEGYWGHKSSYNKELKDNGATSECFAEIGSHIMRNDKEALEFLSGYMPESIEEYRKSLDEVLDYVRQNRIHY